MDKPEAEDKDEATKVAELQAERCDQLTALPGHLEDRKEPTDDDDGDDKLKQVDKKHFDRLNPNRRSLSSPNLANQQAAGNRRPANRLLCRPQTLVNGKPRQLIKVRRRTALGLISSLASTGASGGSGGSGGTNSNSNRCEHNGPACACGCARPDENNANKQPTSGWRSFWFSTSTLNSPASNKCARPNQQKGLLRNLSSHLKQRELSPACQAGKQQDSNNNLDLAGPTEEQATSSTTTTTTTTTSSSTTTCTRLDNINSKQLDATLGKTNNFVIHVKDAASLSASHQMNINKCLQRTTSWLRADTDTCAGSGPTMDAKGQQQQQSLVDRLVDSQLDWRLLIGEANQVEVERTHLSGTQIKRQEIIHELIQTERHHCLTLALMRQVYLTGLLRLNESRQAGATSKTSEPTASSHQLEPVDLDRLFPALDELIEVHELFFAHLRLRLVECCQSGGPKATGATCLIGEAGHNNNNNNQDGDHHQHQDKPSRLVGVVGPIGDLLLDQFRLEGNAKHPRKRRTQTSGGHLSMGEQSKQPAKQTKTNGQKLLQAYAKFCGQHVESNKYYKHLMMADKEFRQFIEQCNKQVAACRQRGIPECNLLVTQRPTKYPLLIEQLIKCSKDEPGDEERKLAEALAQCRALLNELNRQLARKESFERLLDIYAHFSPKSFTVFHHKQVARFTKHDLLQHKRLRELRHLDDQVRVWSATRRKLFSCLCLILDDIIVFLRLEQALAGSGPPPETAGSGPTQQAASATSNPTVEASNLLLQRHLAAASGQGEPSPDYKTATTCNGPQQPNSYLHANHLSGAPQNPNQQQQQHQQHYLVKYHFANIDNKSSVISLSKLLIREKAVEDAEPRIYLISSSPRQPEMYELAFRSRRHQANFVDKLRAAIEQRNRTKRAQQQQQLVAGDYYASLCNSQHLSDEELMLINENLDDDDDDHQSCLSSSGSSSSSASSSGSLAGTAKEHDHEELNQLELDIEQDVVPGPEDVELGQRSGEVQVRQAGQTSAHNSDTDDADEPNESGLSERARDSCDESAPNRLRTSHLRNQQQHQQRRRRAQRPRQVSNQSTSSTCESLAAAATRQQPPKQVAPADSGEDVDSGRGHDDSSSTSSNSMAARLQAEHPADTKELGLESPKGSPGESLSSCSSSCSSSAYSSNVTTTTTTTPNESSLGPASQPAKSTSKQTKDNQTTTTTTTPTTTTTTSSNNKQHRKLSTVSSMSSQLKLLSRLRSINVADGNGGHFCAQCRREGKQAAPVRGTLSGKGHQLMRRGQQFVPEQKLEELRDIRIQLEKDKQEWQEKFNRMQEQLLNERRDLDLARERLKLDRQQVANEREQLYRKLDLLKEKGIILSPSHKVIITSPLSPAPPQALPPPAPDYGQHIRLFNQRQAAHQPQMATMTSNGTTSISVEQSHLSSVLAKMPVHLATTNQPTHNQQQQRPHQQPQMSRMVPFIGSLPGATFLAERFGASL